MKKILSLILVLPIALSLCTLNASATEINDTEKVRRPLTDDEFDQLLMDTFPEYAERISAPPPISTLSSEVSNDLIFSETRKISDTEELTYQEFADGRRIGIFSVDVSLLSSTGSTNYYTKTYDFQVRHISIPGSMYLNGLKYTIVLNGYDRIDNKGTLIGSGVYNCSGPHLAPSNETASGKACVSASCQFESISSGSEGMRVDCTLIIYVGNDTMTYTTLV